MNFDMLEAEKLVRSLVVSTSVDYARGVFAGFFRAFGVKEEDAGKIFDSVLKKLNRELFSLNDSAGYWHGEE